MKASEFAVLTLAISILSLGEPSFAKAKDKNPIQGSIAIKGKPKSEYLPLAKLTVQDAISIATKTTSGKITEAALEKEDGFLVYEVEVLMPDQTRKELLIDAGDGKILLAKENRKSKKDVDDDEDNE